MTYVFFEKLWATTVAYFIGYLNPPNAEKLSQKTIVFKLINATVVSLYNSLYCLAAFSEKLDFDSEDLT